MLTLLIFVIILGVLVLVHEFGHFIAARRNGVKVEEFAFGFPPTLWSIKRGDTTYQINLIPFGGYVKLYGEDGSHANLKNSFSNLIWWRKVIIVSAGVFMNLLMAGFLLGITFMIGLPVVTQNPYTDYPFSQATPETYIYQAQENSPLYGKIQEGDKIISLNSVQIENISDFKKQLSADQGKVSQISIKRNNESISYEVQPYFSNEYNEWQLGVVLVEGYIIKYPFYLAFLMGFVEMIKMMWLMIYTLFVIIKDLIFIHEVPMEIAGPVGIYQIAGMAWKMGFVYLIQLIAVLNINLAIINLLPLPAIDGGRIFVILGEKLLNKKMPIKIENMIHTIGFFALIGILILVTINDIKKFI